MLFYGATSTTPPFISSTPIYVGAVFSVQRQYTWEVCFQINANNNKKKNNIINGNGKKIIIHATGLLAAAMILSAAAPGAVEPETLSNIPQMLSGECASSQDCKKARIQRPKSRKAESCTIKCVATCIRGGDGSPGEGPLNIRRPLVVFKQGFRSRQYCLVECSDICNLIGDGDDGP